MASEKRFGYEWNKYNKIVENYEPQLKNWIYPFQQESFQNKIILDAGCGMGRNSYWMLKWGALEVFAFDHDQRAVAAAKKNLEEFPKATVFFKNIYEIDWQNKFDIAFSIGVIHHLKDPKLALEKLINSLKNDGVLIIWVYSFEGNEWIVKYLDPLRKIITSKLPVGFVHLLSYFFSIPLWLYLKIFKQKNPYLKQIAQYKFWHVRSIVFDQLIPEIANYWRKEEVLNLFNLDDFKELKIYRPPNECGWTVIGLKR